MNKRAFTLVEMLIVVIIISGLMFLIIPNITKTKASVETQTCEAYMKLAESQIQAYIVDHNGSGPATISDLVNEHYIKASSCPDGTALELDGETIVTTTASTGS